MKIKRIVLSIAIASLVGCTTPYIDAQRSIYLNKQKGEISEDQYLADLKELQQEQPWGGENGQANQKPLPAITFSK